MLFSKCPLEVKSVELECVLGMRSDLKKESRKTHSFHLRNYVDWYLLFTLIFKMRKTRSECFKGNV